MYGSRLLTSVVQSRPNTGGRWRISSVHQDRHLTPDGLRNVKVQIGCRLSPNKKFWVLSLPSTCGDEIHH